MSGVKKLKFLFIVSLMIFPMSAHAAERLMAGPNGYTLYNAQRYSGVVMSAYQKAYAMNFEIWKPRDLPAGWYATFDGFPVAQIAEDRWVYGQLAVDGTIRPTNVLIGSVVPSNVPGLVRIASVWSYGRYLDSKEFLVIKDYRCNRMGWLDLDKYHASTLIAWNTRKVGVWLWLGNRWRRFTPNPGEYTWQMLKRLTPYIADELRKANAWYQGGEPFEVADLARQWGLIWSGKVILDSLNSYYNDGGSDGNVTSMRDSPSGGGGDSTPQEPEQETNSYTQWDVD
ncbi:MAG: hypothetical protein IJP53_08985 [Synergistaceae bacterium]|nr:hypothetical protein [Synergistaceae bacterium]MBR0093724.1 hypothetical protein [Synergistaceae bacterium]